MALTIHLLSPKAYRHLQKTKVLPLPGESTLRKYITRFQIREGLLENVCHFLKTKVEGMDELDKIVGISFDEVHIKKTIDYDSSSDQILGPNSSSNVVLVRGIGGKSFKIPVWYRFGYNLTKNELLTIINKLNDIGLTVVSTTCDMGPSNRGLAKSLGVSKDQPYFLPPEHQDKPVFFLYDTPHLLKLIRLHLLDKGFILKSGTTITKNMLVAIHSAIKGNDITAGHHLTDAHIHVKRQDQQSVKKAARVLSWRTASVIRLLAPEVAPDPAENEAMLEMSNFIAMADKWFDVSNSQLRLDRKKMRCGLRVYHDEQVSAMEEFYQEVDALRVVGKPGHMTWQIGILHTIPATLLLYEHLKDNHGMKYLLTRRLNQDPLEQTFSKLRAMGGPNANPGSLEFQRRLRLLILGGMNKVIVQGSLVCNGLDDDVTVLTLDDLLAGFQRLEEATSVTTTTTTTTTTRTTTTTITTTTTSTSSSSKPPEADHNDNDNDIVIPDPVPARDLAIEEGFKYVCGFLLKKAGWEEKMIKNNDIVQDDQFVESAWIDSLNTGGLSYPAKSVVEDVKKMDALFVRYHKESADGLKRGPNVTKDFANFLETHFRYPRKFLDEFSFSRTMFRLRQMKLDLLGTKESARSKKKCIDFGY